MATMNANKGSAKSTTNGTRAKPATKPVGASSRRTIGKRLAARRDGDSPPISNVGIASLIGAGIALGVGLFATRSRWIPFAEDLNNRVQARLNRHSETSDNGFEDDDRFDPVDDAGIVGEASATTGSLSNPSGVPAPNA